MFAFREMLMPLSHKTKPPGGHCSKKVLGSIVQRLVFISAEIHNHRCYVSAGVVPAVNGTLKFPCK